MLKQHLIAINTFKTVGPDTLGLRSPERAGQEIFGPLLFLPTHLGMPEKLQKADGMLTLCQCTSKSKCNYKVVILAPTIGKTVGKHTGFN